MTIEQLLSSPIYTEKYILQKLLMEKLKITREQLWLEQQREISPEHLEWMISAYKQYVEEKKPLEYILGHVTFFQKEFLVTPDTLIPRPETEYMIEAVNEYMQADTPALKVLFDIGTGCGVLGTSVTLNNKDRFSDVIFTDISEGALAVAKKNYDTYIYEGKHTFNLLKSNLLSFLRDKNLNFAKQEVVLVANLPYIPEETFDQNVSENVKNWEPKMAFVGGDDGLIYYKEMFDQIIKAREEKRLDKVVMFLEMMTWQKEILERQYGQNFEFEEVKTFHFNIIILRGNIKA